MGKQLTAKDLGLDDDYEEEEETSEKSGTPEKDSSTDFKGGPWGDEEPGEIGAEAVEQEIEEKKARQKKAEEEALEERKAKEEKDQESDEKYEYADQKAAEKAVKDAKRKITELSTKSKKLEAIIEDLEKRTSEASKASETIAPPGENPFDKEREKISSEAIMKAAEIKAPTVPDRTDPEFENKWEDYKKSIAEYNTRVAKVWADAQTQIAKVTLEEAQQAERDKKTVLTAINEALDATKFPDGTTLSEIDGILDLFWAQSAVVSKSLPMKDQIEKTVQRCKSIIEKIRGKERQRADKDKEDKENLEVLGRGAKITTKKQPEYPKTMREAQRSVLDKRRLRYSP